MTKPLRFEGADNYVATDDLKLAVNAALTLQRPLLIKGEPGTGKTMLAEEVAAALDMPLLQWHIKSTTKAQQEKSEPFLKNDLTKKLTDKLREKHHAA